MAGVDVKVGDERWLLANSKLVCHEFNAVVEGSLSLSSPVFVSQSEVSRALVALRRLSSIVRNPPLKEIVEYKCLPNLVSLLATPDDAMKLEALWCVTNLAAGPADVTRQVFLCPNLVTNLIRSLRATNPHCVTQCIWALGNLAGDLGVRDQLLDLNVSKEIAPLANDQTISVERSQLLSWLVVNCCRDLSNAARVEGLLKPTLSMMAWSSDNETVDNCLHAFQLFLFCRSDEESNLRITSVVATGAVPVIVGLLGSKKISANTLLKASEVCAQILSGSDDQTQIALDHGFLKYVPNLLTSSRADIVQSAVFGCSNVASGTNKQFELLLAAVPNILPKILRLSDKHRLKDRNHALTVVSHICHHGHHIESMIKVEGFWPGLAECVRDSMKTPDDWTNSPVLINLQTLFAKCPDQNPNTYAAAFAQANGRQALKTAETNQDKNTLQLATKLLDALPKP